MFYTIGLTADGRLSLYGGREYRPGRDYLERAAEEAHYTQILVIKALGGSKGDCLQVARYEHVPRLHEVQLV